MEINKEKIMVLFQRRYNAIREIDKLTKELEEMVSRNDSISAAMVLQLRADEMEKADRCMEDIWQIGEESSEAYRQVKLLMEADFATAAGGSKVEEKIFEIRRKTQIIINRLQEADKRLNRRIAGNQSFYKAVGSVR